MGQLVIHKPRVAWDGARTIVAAIDAGCHPWLGYQMGERFGVEYQRRLDESWWRMITSSRPDAASVEAGLWRTVLADLLDQHPELTGALLALIDDAKAQLP